MTGEFDQKNAERRLRQEAARLVNRTIEVPDIMAATAAYRKPRPEPLHECGVACGISYDPMCPCWSDTPAMPLSRQTVSELLATFRSPIYGPMLRSVILDLIADDIAAAVEATVEAALNERGKN